jgi:hypothetical protein
VTQLLRRSIETRSVAWLLLGVFIITANLTGGTRPPVFKGSGAGSNPNPPTFTIPNAFNLPGLPPVQLERFPLVVSITGAASSYWVAVTAESGAVVAFGKTNAAGVAVLLLPAGRGLELDILGTSVVGLPVHAGQSVQVVIP